MSPIETFVELPFPGDTSAVFASEKDVKVPSHPGGNPGANLKSISRRCYLFQVAFVWELTKETIVLPLGCLKGGSPHPTTPLPTLGDHSERARRLGVAPERGGCFL